MIQSVLSAVEPTQKVGILYDIGCSMDKYIRLRGLLPEDRNRISFGTSVFHAYVHNWLCQLEYHPRFNKGWGLSDGEGLERMWSYLSPLWAAQRSFQGDHTEEEQTRRAKLVSLYKREETLELMRFD
ncbi:hypothetical protein PTTG_03449 [Puccinia triticina 1-1 BBBD Race 1]|uniref:Uncharacterized protein n=1 Tax=Puccinia triticina (isolate 1-1 / race 1 (BBBD)) TaxID=630390 RepID=A0A180GUL1_PUCT1|nr:hypothetical protein PTTG_03449 [Puccinia triticina 1-1 BBBD Race 1]